MCSDKDWTLTQALNSGAPAPAEPSLRGEEGYLKLMTMEGNVTQKATPLARELTRIFSSYNKHTVQLKKNLKETNAFFREIRQNYSNACASTVSSDTFSLEAGEFELVQQKHQHTPLSVHIHVAMF